MKTQIEALKKRRIQVFLVCIFYFFLLLAVGYLIFLKNSSYAIQLTAACIALYFFIVRPVLSRYKRTLRSTILEINLGCLLSDVVYNPKAGLSLAELERTGLTPVPLSSHLSRELVTGHSGGLQVKLADITFPFRSGSMNEMFNGCALSITSPEHDFVPLHMEAGEYISGEWNPQLETMVTELGSWIPGNLFVNTSGKCLWVFLRGRFLGYPINPLMDITEKTLSTDPLPELKVVLELAQKLMR